MTTGNETSSVLGRMVDYPEHYDASILQAISRQQGRELLHWESDWPFEGEDIWTAYELSWLNERGLPQVALGELRVSANSPNMVESKSLKLYFNSFNQTHFTDWKTVQATVQKDVSACVGSDVEFVLFSIADVEGQTLAVMPGDCIDNQPIRIEAFELHGDVEQVQEPNADKLKITSGSIIEETLHSHLLKSNCRITSQPDWASVLIRYKGKPIDREALLRYIIGFRQHDEFHEPCVEKIFMDVWRQCQPEQLTVYARYTRRGGLDINPFRSNFEVSPANIRLPRQ